MRVGFCLWSLLIAYGSLFPFDFQAIDLTSELSSVSWCRIENQWDVLANIVLFVPLGWLLFSISSQCHNSWLAPVLGTLLFAAALQFAQIFLASRVASPIDVGFNGLGMALGAVAWRIAPPEVVAQSLTIRQSTGIARIASLGAALGLLLGYAIFNLSPFELSSTPNVIHWLPFDAYLHGARSVGLISLLEKILVYGVASWLLRKTSVSAMVLAGAPLCAVSIEALQIWMPSATVDSTEIVIACGLAVLVGKLPLLDSCRTAQQDFRTLHEMATNRNFAFAAFVLACATIGLLGALEILLRLPAIPYNVRELFGNGGLAAKLAFASAVLTLGFAPVLAGRLAGTNRWAVAWLPLLLLACATLTYNLMQAGVSGESMRDITGSVVFAKQLDPASPIGELIAALMRHYGRDNILYVLSSIEPMLRFSALITPLIVAQIVIHAFVFRAKLLRPHRESGLWHLGISMTALACLAAAKWIVVDHASTDNLTELMRGRTAFGVPGWASLSAACAMLASVAAISAWSLIKPSSGRCAFACTLLLGAAPLAYLLLDAGLESNVRKYGHTYSAMTFLLGPDRGTALTSTELFSRWLGLYLGACTLIASAAWSAIVCFKHRLGH